MRQITYCEALTEGITQEMERDESVFVYGIGAPDHKKIFGTTNGLVEKFGPERCFDTPLCEDAMTGFGLGAALNGMRPIHIHIRVDFMLLAINQLVNMVSSFCYGSAGRLPVPFVIRVIVGRGWGQGFQHSKTLHSYFAHIPGLKVILPTTPYDAKGMIVEAIRDKNPVICIEHRWLYWAIGDVPTESYAIPFGKAQILREGRDLTIIATSWMAVEALKAADILSCYGFEAEVVDPRSIAPLDTDALVASIAKTGHCLVADNDWTFGGFSGEIVAQIAERAFSYLKKSPMRIGFAHTPCPTVRCLENEFYRNAEDIVNLVTQAFGMNAIDMSDEDFYSHERRFKGPF